MDEFEEPYALELVAFAFALRVNNISTAMPSPSTKSALNFVDFKKATDRSGELGMTHEAIAEALGVAPSTVRASRLDPSSPNYRKPPDGWREKLSKAAHDRGGELARLAEELEG